MYAGRVRNSQILSCTHFRTDPGQRHKAWQELYKLCLYPSPQQWLLAQTHLPHILAKIKMLQLPNTGMHEAIAPKAKCQAPIIVLDFIWICFLFFSNKPKTVSINRKPCYII